MKIAIISDIHEDIVNLERAFQKIEKHKVDEVICLGDIVGFSVPYYNYLDNRNASACINLVKKNCKIVLVGNHDLFAIRKLPVFKSDFEFPENWYEMDFPERKKMAGNTVWLYEDKELSALLTLNDKMYLETLNEFEFCELGGMNFLFSHYLYPDLSGSSIHMVDDHNGCEQHFGWMKSNNCHLSFCGHAHIEGYDILSEKGTKQKAFVRTKIKNEAHAVLSPAIARGRSKSGFLIVDTNELTIEAKKMIN
jgi:predicted phosphodiesterase